MNYNTYEIDEDYPITTYSTPGYWRRLLWSRRDYSSIKTYSSKVVFETVYKCGGDLVPYGCQMIGDFGGNCCVDYCLQPGYFNKEDETVKQNPSGFTCEEECCLPKLICGNGIL